MHNQACVRTFVKAYKNKKTRQTKRLKAENERKEK